MAVKYNIGVGFGMRSMRGKLMLTYFCSMLSLSILNICMSVIPSQMSDNASNVLFSLISQMVCMGLVPIVGLLLTKRRRAGEGLGEYGLRLARNWRYHMPTTPKCWLAVIPLAVSFYFFTQLMARISNLVLGIAQYTFPAGHSTVYGGVGDLIKWIAIGALLPAVFEELTHRGLLIDAMSDRGNEIETVLWSGLLFGAMHTNVMQFFYAFIGGMVFAFLVIKTNSIFPAMLLHFCNNAFAHIEEYAGQHPTGVFALIDQVNSFFRSSNVAILFGAGILVANMVLAIWLLSTVQRVSGKPEGLQEKWFLRSKSNTYFAFSLDAYRPYGKASIADNLFLYAAFAMTIAMTVFSYVWGVLR
jgi:membrane protease YdiL (CAAX protease family)